jgi:type II restriction/modification system DNA methylase subunit YeeA
LIDFPLHLEEIDASLFELPFEYLSAARYDPDSATDKRTLQEARSTARDDHARNRWWEPYWPRPEMRSRIQELSRYIVTAETAQHRIFVWASLPLLPDKNLIVVARDDDTAFGVLQSRFHEGWSLRLGTSLEDRPRYTSTTTFETFPFPAGLTPNIPAADTAADPRAQRIAAAAKTLDDLRRAWLNPPDLVEIVPEVTPTAAPGEAPRRYPDRILPKTVEAAVKLKERTLTNLYNQRPRWLADAHDALDRAVASAYGWPEDIATDDALQRLLALNLERSSVASARSRGEG